MDAIALHQYGFDCAVASLGTSLTEEHAAILSRYTEQVYLIYDGDEAGQRAAQRAIPMLEKAGIRIKVLKMRDAKDPDEFLTICGRMTKRSAMSKKRQSYSALWTVLFSVKSMAAGWRSPAASPWTP